MVKLSQAQMLLYQSWIQNMLEQKTIHDKIKKFCYILISFTDRAVVPINLFVVGLPL